MRDQIVALIENEGVTHFITGMALGVEDVYKRQQEGMSEIQTVKTAIHEIAHAKLHAVKPDEKATPEDKMCIRDRVSRELFSSLVSLPDDQPAM